MLRPIAEPNKPFWPARWWWIALGLILIVAAAFRFIGWNFSLPYIDTPREPNFALAGLLTLTKGSAKSYPIYGYAPGLTTLYYFLIRFFGSPTANPLTMIGTVRIISIVISLGCVALIALLGYRASTPLAGLFAAGMWSVAPQAINYSRYARPDIYLSFFCLLALFLAISGAIYDRDKLATWGVVALLFGIIFKYSAAGVAPAILIAPLVRWLGSTRENKRRVLINLGNQLLILAVFAFWLYALTPAAEANNIPNYAAPASQFGIPTPDALWINLTRSVRIPGFGLMWIPGAVGLLLIAFPRFRTRLSLIGLGTVTFAAMLWEGGVSLYGPEDFRQLIFLSMLLVILFGVGLGLLAEGLVWLSERVRLPRMPIRYPVSGAIVAVALVLIGLPKINGAVASSKQHILPDRRVELWAWGDMTLEPGASYIGSPDTEAIFLPGYSGYDGVNQFNRFKNARLVKYPLDEWRKDGVKYAILPAREYKALKTSPQAKDYLPNITLLKSYPKSDQYRDPGMYVFSLTPIQHPLDAQLGSIRLVGYDLSADTAKPGDTLTLTLFWKAAQPAPGDYKVFNHLMDGASNLLAQVDGPPLFDARRPTSAWDDPDEVIMSRGFDLVIGKDAAPGDYPLITGFYREDTGARLLGPHGEDHVQVVVIHVGP